MYTKKLIYIQLCLFFADSSLMISGTQIHSILFLASSNNLWRWVNNFEKLIFYVIFFTQLFHDVENFRRKKFHQKHPKFQPWWNSSVLKKPMHVTFFKILRSIFATTTLKHSCLHVSFSKAAIIKSKAKNFFNSPILNSVTITFFCLRVWLFEGLAETSFNHFEQKL